MADNAIEAKIGANIEGFRRGTSEAKGHVDDLISHLRDFKKEAVSTGRQAKFFAAELAEIIPGADGAKNALRSLLTVGLAGGGIHSLVAGVKFLIEAFHGLTAEEDKANENFAKFIEDQKKSVDALQVSIEKMLLTMRGATRAQILEFEQTHELLERKKAKQEELRKATEDLVADQDRMNAADVEGAIGMSVLVAVSEKRVAGIRGEIKALDDLLAKKREAITPLAGADAAAADLQMRINREIVAQKVRNEEEAAVALGRLRASEFHDEDVAAKQSAEFKEALAREIAEAQMRADDETAKSAGNLAAIYREQDRAQQEAAAALAIRVAGVKKAVTEMGTHFSAAIKGMVRGTLDLGEAMKNIGLGIIDSIIDAFVKMAEAAIISAIIGKHAAARDGNRRDCRVHVRRDRGSRRASQAAIPVVGPGLATAAATRWQHSSLA
jgi:hypothetical protein